MDFTSAAFVFLLCLAGALIAFVADNLGRHLGKNRKSLFGLRPRHTATLLTTGAGFLVPLLTVFLVTVASRDLRTILVEGTNLIKRRDLAEQQAAQSTADLEKTTQRLTSVQKQAEAETKKAAAAEKLSRASEQRLSTATKELENRRTEVKQLLTQASTLRETLAGLRRSLDTSKRSLDQSRRQLRESQAKNASLVKESKDLDSRIKYINSELERSYEQARTLDQELQQKEKLLGELSTKIEQLEGERVIATQELERVARQFGAELERVKLDLDQKRSELDGLNVAAKELEQGLLLTRMVNIIFARNEEVARVLVPARVTPEQARGYVANALRDAAAVAEARGARGKGTSRAAAFLDINEAVTAESQREELARQITNQPEPKLIILTALWNSFEGETTGVRGTVFDNRLIYREGDLITEIRVDGSATDDTVLGTLRRLVTVNLADKIRRDGVIPVAGSNQAGEVTLEELLRLTREVRAEDRQIRVQILARQEIRAAGPVRIVFRLR